MRPSPPPGAGEERKNAGGDGCAGPRNVTAIGAIEILPLTPERWDQALPLFGDNGLYANCWCTWWRLRSKDWDAAGAAGRRAMFEELVREGREPGLVAFDDGEPVGWVSVGPRDDFPRQQRSPVLAPPDETPGVWTVNCFWIRKDRRGRGVAQALLRAATEHALARGATAVDGIPVDPDERAKAADAYTGVVAMFASEGYVEVARRKPRSRVVMRYPPEASGL